jgi:RNA polymerase sigma-70 factor, ECF subfamily
MPLEKGSPLKEIEKDQMLEELMNSLGNQVLYTAFSYVKDYEMAEDIAQEVFVKAYRQSDKFRGDSSIKTWIIRITINQSKDYLRSWYCRKILLSNKISSFVKGKEEAPESDQLVKQVLYLPLKFREVLFLYFFEELTLKEISEVLNQNISTTKSRFYKAKELLSEVYSKGENLV